MTKDEKPEDDFKQEVIRTQNEINILKEMKNLEDNGYYRLQIISLLGEIAEALKSKNKTE